MFQQINYSLAVYLQTVGHLRLGCRFETRQQIVIGHRVHALSGRQNGCSFITNESDLGQSRIIGQRFQFVEQCRLQSGIVRGAQFAGQLQESTGLPQQMGCRVESLQDMGLMLHLIEWTLHLVLQPIGSGLESFHVAADSVQSHAKFSRMTGL